MEERALIAVLAVGVGLGCVALLPRLDRGLDWVAEHLRATPVAMVGAGLVIAAGAFIVGAEAIALTGLALGAAGGVVHRVASEHARTAAHGSSDPDRGTVAS